MGVEVELRFFAMFRDEVGAKRLVREFEPGTTVGEALLAVESEFPSLAGRFVADDGGIGDALTVMRNGTNVTHFDGAGTTLTDGDRLSVTPPVTGGAAGE